MKRIVLSGLLFALLSVTPSFAAFHFMVIQEVFLGPPSEGTGAPLTPNQRSQYVVLRMTSSGQQFVSGSSIRVEDANGNLLGTFGSFPANLGNGGAACVYPVCPAIVIGTQLADNMFTFAFDRVVDGEAGRVALPRSGGRACFVLGTTLVDCVAWGDFDCTRSGNCRTCSNNPNLSCTTNANCGAGTCVQGVNVMRIGDSNGNGCDVNFGTPSAPGGLEYGRSLARTMFNCAAKENSTQLALAFPRPVTNTGANNNVDADADGLIDVLDCDDTSAAFLWPIADLPNLRTPDKVTLSYSQAAASGTGATYDVVRGSVPALNGFTDAAALQCDEPTGTIQDATDPIDGQGYYYLVRAGSSGTCGGTGTYGSGTSPALDALCP